MGSIRVRPETKKLYFDFQWRNHRCREYTTLADKPASRRRMQKVLDNIEADIALNSFDYAQYFPNSSNVERFSDTPPAPVKAAPPDTPYFRDFVEVWKQEKAIGWRLGYREAMDSILNAHLLPVFGDIPVGAIDRPRLLQFRAALGQKRIGANRPDTEHALNPSTINRAVGVMRQILDEAALRYDFTNPAVTIKRLKVPRVDIQPFTMDGVKLLIDTVRKDYRAYLTVRCFTGMRSGEANGLKWKHVDFERGEILIRETFSHGRTEYTKTDGSQREIRMAPPVEDALRRHRPAPFDPEAYVFHTRNGRPIDNKNFHNRVWLPLLRHLGLKRRRAYDMRHTCATLWLAAGESPEWIARQLGHTTTEMLFRVYSRYVPNLTRNDGRAFNQLVTAALNGAVVQDEAGRPSGRPARSLDLPFAENRHA
ncbi:MAG TPA: DUF3596 domain-containing protein [Nevskiaceae bacterium]|nr:DUF3596 domain-containing protein [Nevskiaceae bacterium]